LGTPGGDVGEHQGDVEDTKEMLGTPRGRWGTPRGRGGHQGGVGDTKGRLGTPGGGVGGHQADIGDTGGDIGGHGGVLGHEDIGSLGTLGTPWCHHDGGGPHPHPSSPHIPKVPPRWRWGCPQGATMMGMVPTLIPLVPMSPSWHLNGDGDVRKVPPRWG